MQKRDSTGSATHLTERLLGAALALVVVVLLPAAVILTSRGAFDGLVGKTYRQSELEAAVRRADRAGYSRGHAAGYDSGYADGDRVGFDEGYDQGLDAGYEAGCESVFDRLYTTRVVDYWESFADYSYVSSMSSVEC